MATDEVRIRRALIGVSAKDGLNDLARALEHHQIEVISTGGTRSALKEAGFNVTAVEHFTDFPEILDGRVKTLHPKIHGGILARRSDESHRRQMERHAIEPIDLVVVN